jgi:septal ring factor EnvC (AmiA/AmiB activator)
MLLGMNKKITTIDDLAVMIGKESQLAEKRFHAMEGKIDIMATEIKEIRTDIKEIRADLSGVHKGIDSIHKKINGIYVDIKTTDTRNAVISLGLRVSKLEGTV